MENVLAGARILINDCANIKAGEKVVIVTDSETLSSAQIIADAATRANADVIIKILPCRTFDGEEPTDEAASAMLEADVVLMPVTKSLAHTNATRNALANGARVLSLTGTSTELLASDAYGADFSKERPTCNRVADMFSQANIVRVQSAAGTDLTVSAKGRVGQAHSCIVEEPGEFSAAPNIEASFAPVEGTAQGVFVADASIPYLGIGMLGQPVVFTIEKGRVVELSGGNQADVLREIWESQDDPNVYNLAQVAIGLNPAIKKPIGYLGCNYDEGAIGTAHIGIGTSSNLGGTVKCSTHFDALMLHPTITLDGKLLLEDGILCLS